jgi:Fe-S cluster biogenesis protein NfuA
MARHGPDAGLSERVRRIAGLLDEVDQFADPAARAHTREIVRAILDFHGAGMSRILEHLGDAGGHGQALLARLAEDDLVGSLLLLYGLHPLDPETRVRRALDKVRPALRAHGGDVELIGIAGDVAHVRLRSGGSCASSAQGLRRSVDEAIYAAAPEVAAIEVQEWLDYARGTIPLPML